MAIDLEPQSREEMYLANIDNGGQGTIPATPQSRKEMYLDSISKGANELRIRLEEL